MAYNRSLAEAEAADKEQKENNNNMKGTNKPLPAGLPASAMEELVDIIEEGG